MLETKKVEKNFTSMMTLGLAHAVIDKGFRLCAIQVYTHGLEWHIVTAKSTPFPHPLSITGFTSGEVYGYRLFGGDRVNEENAEHTPPFGTVWFLDSLVDYLGTFEKLK